MKSHTWLARALVCIFKIGLPLARPALFAALSLLTMEVVNDYGAIHFFGIPTLTEGIFHAWFALEDSVSALRISLLLMLLILPFFAIESYFRRRKRYSSGELAQQRVPKKTVTCFSADGKPRLRYPADLRLYLSLV